MIDEIKSLQFIKAIENEKGIVYLVGGCVRDYVMGIKPNDIDLLVSKIDIDYLVNILTQHGKVDLIGKSFGILKFKCSENKTEYEIALPRTEVSIGKKHTDVEINYDKDLPIEKDLYRRDLTINSMAMMLSGILIDPYEGALDIKRRIIRKTNNDSFNQDPLRLLRAVRFGITFDFDYDRETLNDIRKSFNEGIVLTPERTSSEFNKILNFKTDIIYKHLFETRTLMFISYGFDDTPKKNFSSYTEYLKLNSHKTEVHLLFKDSVINDANYSKEEKLAVLYVLTDYQIDIQAIIEGSSISYDRVRLIAHVYSVITRPYDYTRLALVENVKNIKYVSEHLQKLFFSMIEPILIKKSYLNSRDIEKSKNFRLDVCNKIISGEYPTDVKDLDINGYELQKLGFFNEDIKKVQNELLKYIYNDSISNKNIMLINAAKTLKND